MTLQAKWWMHLFRIVSYCVVGCWLFILTPLTLRDIMYEGALDAPFVLSVAVLGLYFVGIPVAILTVSRTVAKKGLVRRIVEWLWFCVLIWLLLPAWLDYLRVPEDRAEYIFFLVLLTFYMLVFLGTMLIRLSLSICSRISRK